jgi:2,4-dienoyl-CoA reductase-like NADH-dependent reductase (Old Yellow Enzyme family)
MSRDEIEEVEEQFVTASRRAQVAGFDAVEIHAAHGYLHTQFLSPITNRRSDEYGGSLPNRARFLLETVARIRASVGTGFPIFVRLGSTDGDLPGGFTPDDAACVAHMLEEAGVALIDISGGFASSIRPAGSPPGYFVENAARVRRSVAVPVMVAGGITEAGFAEKILQEGHADLAGVGRAIFRDPQWVAKAREELSN